MIDSARAWPYDVRSGIVNSGATFLGLNNASSSVFVSTYLLSAPFADRQTGAYGNQVLAQHGEIEGPQGRVT